MVGFVAFLSVTCVAARFVACCVAFVVACLGALLGVDRGVTLGVGLLLELCVGLGVWLGVGFAEGVAAGGGGGVGSAELHPAKKSRGAMAAMMRFFTSQHPVWIHSWQRLNSRSLSGTFANAN